MTFLLQSELAARGWAVTLNGDNEHFDLREAYPSTAVMLGMSKELCEEFLDWLDNVKRLEFSLN